MKKTRNYCDVCGCELDPVNNRIYKYSCYNYFLETKLRKVDMCENCFLEFEKFVRTKGGKNND